MTALCSFALDSKRRITVKNSHDIVKNCVVRVFYYDISIVILSDKVYNVIKIIGGENMVHNSITANEALERLRIGNAFYSESSRNTGDISETVRTDTLKNGQRPYAVIVSCSDSRVIPEVVFNAGIGDLFVIRVAGNVIDDHQLGSIEYAVSHLGIKLVVVLGHNHCGAVDAAVNHDPDGFVKFITDEIRRAIGEEKDEYKACCLNVARSVSVIEESFEIQKEEEHGLRVIGAIYRLEDGMVSFNV